MSLTEGYQPVVWNFKLLAHDRLAGFGGMGEGMSVQIAADGRRIIWLAHESAPKNFTAVDVTDPRQPKVVCQTDLPHANMRSNSLETSGNLMAVAYQTSKKDLQPAGFELFDISQPENPKSISFFDCSGDTSRGVHQLWFCDGEYVHMAVARVLRLYIDELKANIKKGFMPPPDNNVRMDLISGFFGVPWLTAGDKIDRAYDKEQLDISVYKLTECRHELLGHATDALTKVSRLRHAARKLYNDFGYHLDSHITSSDFDKSIALACDIREKFSMLTQLKNMGLLERLLDR